MNKTTSKYTPEIRERVVRTVLNGQGSVRAVGRRGPWFLRFRPKMEVILNHIGPYALQAENGCFLGYQYAVSHLQRRSGIRQCVPQYLADQ